MRKILPIVILGVFLVLFFAVTVHAQRSFPQAPAIPEVNGDFPDPEHPGVRVRVFVHGPKGPVSTSTAAVCTDPDSSATVSAAGWHLPSTTWTYNLNLSSVPVSVGSGNLPTISANGFSQWTNAISSSSSKPTITRGSDTTVNKSAYDGLNVITWGRTSGTALAVTYIRYWSSTGIVVDVDTIMNTRVLWSWSGSTSGSCGNSNSYDAQDILTHEEGHWFGLDDQYTSAYVDNTMYGYGAKNETKKDTITTGDSNGIKAIYP